MLDLGWQEFMVIALVLVVVVGPKDLPKVLRAFAKFMGKARGMAREFQTSMMEVANQEEFRDVKKAFDDAKSGRIEDFSGPMAEVKDAFDDAQKDSGLDESVKSIKSTADDLKMATAKEADKVVAGSKTEKSRNEPISGNSPSDSASS